MTISNSKKDKWQKCPKTHPSTLDVICLVMDALVNVLVHEVLTAMRTVTPKNPMIAIQNAHASGLGCSIRLIVANQNAHASGLGCSIRLMVANQNAHAFGPSCSNQLKVANQNAHAFGLSSTVVRMKMMTRSKSLAVAMTKMMVAIRVHSIHHRLPWSSS